MNCPEAMSTGRRVFGWPRFTRWAARLYRREAFAVQRITSRTLLSVVDQGAVSGAAFASVVVIGRTCPPAELGFYALGFSVVLLMTQAQSALVAAPYTVYLTSQPFSARRRYTGSAIVHSAALSAVVTLGLALVLVAWRPSERSGLLDVLRVLTLALPAILLRQNVRSVFFANLWFGRACALDAIVGTVQVAALFLLGRVGLLDAARAYVVIGGVAGLAALVAMFSIRRECVVDVRRALLDVKVSWSFGKWVLADYATLVAGSQLYPWFLAGSRGPEATAVFAACMGTAGLANPVLLGMNNVLAPTMARSQRAGREDLAQSVRRATGAIALAGVAFSLLSVTAGGAFLRLMFGDRYAHHGMTVTLLTMSLFILAASAPAGYALWAMRRPDVNLRSNLLGLLITVGLGPLMVRSGGVLGAASVLVVASAVSGISRAILAWRAIAHQPMHAI